ncbi:MAG: transglycosylase domain-containing protein [Vulcanococcus sp.]|uniref:transglycosylase domain-containing protein n=1 Tax=Vulcanococcus sp. TaxID=2856995 RepID=UPI0025CD9AC6|nr:transglycosylase domain-containing protein [Vulcanococcus sp.]MBW0167824.1 transglycosylase domain-containing protein [Vulcanococcus sp.]
MTARPAELSWSSHGQSEQRRQLQPGTYRIGRDPSAELPIQAAGVSQQHALLEWVDGHWLLTDLNSTNGLWWRGRRIQQLLLCDGDRIRLAPTGAEGAAELVFHQAAQGPWRLLRQWGSAAAAVVAASGLALLGVGRLQVPVGAGLGASRGPLLLFDGADRPLMAAESVQHREQRDLSRFPPELISALLASEDNRFWWHPGIDPIGTARALLTNLSGGRVLEGGSTLTQQLARSVHPETVGRGDTLGRKWRELLVALQLEAGHSKRDLLLSYLNRVYLGVGWGFEDAARHYFARPASDLTLEQAALLVGLLPSPNGFNPCTQPQAALDSRNRVLLKMVEAGRLSQQRARSARRQPLQLAPQACGAGAEQTGQPMPFYTDQVKRDLEALLGADVAAEGNFLVSTYLDPLLQQVVERRLSALLRSKAGPQQGAVVVIDSRNGGILAIAGGRDYSQNQYNRASMALRQPGSTFKLFPYLAALELGLKPSDRVSCAPLEWGGQLFRSGCGGTLSLEQALASSSNTAALRLARRVGLDRVIETARKLGITTPLEAVPGLALGQAEVRLVELTGAYAAVANQGIWHPPSTIRQLTDAEQQRSLTSQAQGQGTGPGRRVLSEAQARQMQAMLRAVVRSGTGRAARLGGEEWGKTGTTNNGRDLLFIGAEPSRHWVMGVWLGNDDNTPTGSSSALAAELWGEIIRSAGRGSLDRGITLR